MKRLGFIVGFLLLSSSLSYASFQDGLAAYNNGDFGKALTIWEEQGSRGDVNSQYNLGLFYERGVQGYPKDLAAAYAWYRLAASQKAELAAQAVTRLEPLLTSGQIEDGNKIAVSILGRWYRQNVGLKEEDYKKLVEDRARREKVKIEAEKRATVQRAQQQRDLIARRDADAKMATKLEASSREAALKAAREQAEEAKRKAYSVQKQREEKERLAKLNAQSEQDVQRDATLQRLAELKAKQQGTTVDPSIAKIPQKVENLTPTNVTPTQSIVQKPVTAQALSAPNAAAVQETPKQVNREVVATQQQAPQPQQAVPQQNVAEKSAAQVVVASKPAVAQPIAPSKTTLPVIKNGMDQSIVARILEQAQAQDLKTPQAISEISSARTDIEALKWSLISAARGKSGAQKMNDVLTRAMTPAQISEANRRAAEWIIKRQNRG